jgi:hypothetical protein
MSRQMLTRRYLLVRPKEKEEEEKDIGCWSRWLVSDEEDDGVLANFLKKKIEGGHRSQAGSPVIVCVEITRNCPYVCHDT